MIQLDPTQRLSAKAYIEQNMGKIFPKYCIAFRSFNDSLIAISEFYRTSMLQILSLPVQVYSSVTGA